MPVRKAEAEWKGTLREGRGTMKLSSGAFQGAYSFGTRFEESPGTNPEELIGAAHAGCFSMALSGALGRAGFAPLRIHTVASVHIDKVGEGFEITTIHLATSAEVPGIAADAFAEIAEGAKKHCPVSKALTGPKITLDAHLIT
jgi:osmotically inducible protein OsmC